MPTASIQNVRLVIVTASARGLAPAKLLSAVGIEPRTLLDPDARVPEEPVLRLWQLAAEMSADPSFGLSATEHMHPSTYGALGYSLLGSATFGEGLRRLSTFFKLLHQRMSLELIEERGVVRVRAVGHFDGAAAELRHPMECILSALLRMGRKTTGREDLHPVAVSFRHPAPADLAAHRRLFGVEPAFGAPASEIVFPRGALDLPHLGTDPDMTAVMERHLRQLLHELPREETFGTRVRTALIDEIRRGEPTLDRLAARLRVSERTLQRRLNQEGTSLQALLSELRRELSLRHLGESKESIAEIAFLLGFSEVSAFHRAFKRWTGRTPADYRQALHSGSQPPPSAP